MKRRVCRTLKSAFVQMNTYEISAQSILGLMEIGHRKRVLAQDQMYTFQMCALFQSSVLSMLFLAMFSN